MFNLFSRFGRRRQRRSTCEIDVVDIDTFSSVITDCQPSTSTAPYPTDYYVVYSDSSTSMSLVSIQEFLREKDNDTSKAQDNEMPSGKGKCPPGAGKHSKKVSVQESPWKKDNDTSKARDDEMPSVKGKSSEKSKKVSAQESPQGKNNDTSRAQDIDKVPSGKGKCQPGAGKKSKKVSVQESSKGAENEAKDITHLFLARESCPSSRQPPPKPARLSFFERLKRLRKNKVAPEPRMEQKSSVKISIVPELAGFRGEFLASTVALPESESEASSVESSVDLSRLSPVPAVVQDYYPSTLVGFFAR